MKRSMSYLAIGSLLWASVSAVKRSLRQRSRTELNFDPSYYRRTNPDVAASGVDPFQHYLSVGWKEGRDPNPAFSTRGYLQANPDIAALRIHPFLHFVRSGYAEGRGGWQRDPAGAPVGANQPGTGDSAPQV